MFLFVPAVNAVFVYFGAAAVFVILAVFVDVAATVDFAIAVSAVVDVVVTPAAVVVFADVMLVTNNEQKYKYHASGECSYKSYLDN